MKSNYRTYSSSELEKKSREIAQQEIDKYADKFSEIIANQVFACCCYVLHLEFGFGGKRLKRLKDGFEDIADLMEQGVIGKEFNATQAVEWLKSKYGIDLNEQKANLEK